MSTGAAGVGDVRNLSESSSRWTLLMLFGEFVGSDEVWSATIIRALDDLGIGASAARRAIQRSHARGWITPVKEGRRVKWAVTPSGARLIDDGYRRFNDFHGDVEVWDGRWLLVQVSVPESQREARYRLRKRLTWLGLGSSLPGQWITPHVEREPEVSAVLARLGLGDHSSSFVATLGSMGSGWDLVRRTWDLDALDAMYRDFLERFAGLSPTSPQDAMAEYVQMLHAWRQFPFVDPTLPRALLPESWSGRLAASRYRELRAQLRALSHERWGEICSEST